MPNPYVILLWFEKIFLIFHSLGPYLFKLLDFALVFFFELFLFIAHRSVFICNRPFVFFFFWSLSFFFRSSISFLFVIDLRPFFFFVGLCPFSFVHRPVFICNRPSTFDLCFFFFFWSLSFFFRSSTTSFLFVIDLQPFFF